MPATGNGYCHIYRPEWKNYAGSGKGALTDRKLKAVFLFLENLLVFDSPEINCKFVSEFDQFTGKVNTMGVLEQLAEIRAKEGFQKGLAEGKRLAVESLLSRTEFSDEKIAELLNVAVGTVTEIRESLARK